MVFRRIMKILGPAEIREKSFSGYLFTRKKGPVIPEMTDEAFGEYIRAMDARYNEVIAERFRIIAQKKASQEKAKLPKLLPRPSVSTHYWG